jgi:acetyl esterase
MSRNRIADLQLRGNTSPLPVRVYWPAQSAPQPAPVLVFCVAGAGAGARAEAACRRLSKDAGLVVLSVFCVAGAPDGTTVLEWAAEHAAELGGNPGRLMVGGEGAGGAVAAAVAARARMRGWPSVMALPEAVQRSLSAGSDEYPEPGSSALMNKSAEET